MEFEGVFRRRHLPHWDVPGKPIFITACLEGSLSAAGLARIGRYRAELDGHPRPPQLSEHEWERKKEKLVFRLVDELLDHQSPVRHLEDERQAQVVQDAFLHFADERYALLAFVVMPSHHHWLFVPDEEWSTSVTDRSNQEGARPRTPREIISHSIQSYTGTMCNRIRGESGSYWQTETFDHWARDEAEMYRILHYIENNPVKARLVGQPEDWPWSSARIRANAGLQPGDAIRKSHVG
jgi:type I restriction enzyme R subunit